MTSLSPSSDPYVIYVSSTGDDSAPGTSLIEPVKTFKRAADLAKIYFQEGGELNVEIQARGGQYKIMGTQESPIVYLNSTYSPPSGKTLTFKPYNNEQVAILGSERLAYTDFSLVTSADPKWSRIANAARGNVYVTSIVGWDLGPGLPSMWNGSGIGGDLGAVSDFPTTPDLVFNGKLMTVARWPNKANIESNGFAFSECAPISSIVDSGTSGSFCVNADNLENNYLISSDCLCGSGAPYDANCFKDGAFTYSAAYDSVVARWTPAAIAEGIWLHGFWKWDWADEVYKVISINTSTRTIVVRSRNSQYGLMNMEICDQSNGQFLGWDKDWKSNASPRRWFAQNILEELDSPGEYYIDRVSKKLYFWPTEAITSSSDIRLTHRAVGGPAPREDNTFEIGFNENGQPSKTCFDCFPYEGWADLALGWDNSGGAGQSRNVYNTKNGLKSLFKFYGVSNVNIENLTFRDSAGSGIELNLCSDILIKNCAVFNVKRDGIAAMGGKDITIESCTLYDIGRHGIINTGGNRRTLEPANKVVTKCSIKRWNRGHQSYSAAILMDGCGNAASYNLIAFGSLGISCAGNNHSINHNHFHQVQTDAEDSSVIYSGRNISWFGTVIEHNLFTNCKSNLPGGWYVVSDEAGTRCELGLSHGINTIYFDDLQSESTIRKNIFYDCASGKGCCFYANGGVQHKVNNNIFIDSRRPYGSATSSQEYWNQHLQSTRIGIFNPLNWPWYETGGPLPLGSESLPTSGYSPYTHPWVTGWGGWVWYDSAVWGEGGIMPVVDISSTVYSSSAPHLGQMLTINGSAKTATCNPDTAIYKNFANKNVLVSTTSNSAYLGRNGLSSGDNFFQSANTFTTLEEATINNLFNSTEKANLNFELTTQKLNTIRAVIPTFENIDFNTIPTLSYVTGPTPPNPITPPPALPVIPPSLPVVPDPAMQIIRTYQVGAENPDMYLERNKLPSYDESVLQRNLNPSIDLSNIGSMYQLNENGAANPCKECENK